MELLRYSLRLIKPVCEEYLLAEANIHNILVIGTDVVSLTASARRAGYQVYAVDYFGDQDLKRVCHESRSIVEQRMGKTCGQVGADFSSETLLQLTKDLLREKKIDAALLSSGLDDSPDVLYQLNDMIPILGNHPCVIEKIRNKIKFFHELKHIGIPYPETELAENFQETRNRAKDVGYPVLVKPLRGFGGVGTRKVQDHQELKEAFLDASSVDKRILIQKCLILFVRK